MSTDTMQLATSVLAICAAAGAVLLVAARLLAPISNIAARAGAAVVTHRAALTVAVAGVATAASLWFSEVAHYLPCRLCWFQRIAMYPIAVISVVAAIRHDHGARWYAVTFAAIGAPISAYHYLIEWKPSLEGGACGIFGPSCADIWFREFGFITLAAMALAGFVFIIAVNTISFDVRDTDTDS